MRKMSQTYETIFHKPNVCMCARTAGMDIPTPAGREAIHGSLLRTYTLLFTMRFPSKIQSLGVNLAQDFPVGIVDR